LGELKIFLAISLVDPRTMKLIISIAIPKPQAENLLTC
jgi:hypothetical protein